MSNVKVAPQPPTNGDKIPMMPAGVGQISVADLEAAMPKKVAQALQGKVDLNRNGYLDATEIGELFEDLQQSEEKRKMMTLQLIVAVSFLGLSILANLGTAWYAAEAHQTTSTSNSASSTTTQLLTNKDGLPLRVDRSLDEHPMGSLLPDSAFQSLEYLAITGPKGSLRMKVEATARFELATAQYNSVVVVYTSLGSVEFDGTNMLMTDTTADAFHRAGFTTKKSRRSDSHNPHQRFARDVSKITGMFGSLSKLELSEFSKATTNENGDKIIPFMNNVLANMSEAYIQEDTYIKCEATGTQSTTDCHGGVVGESLFEFEEADGSTFTYLKRTKHMVSKVIEGKMMTYAETTMAEYPGARLVDLTGEGSKIATNYVLSDSSTGYDAATKKGIHSTFYCDVDDNVTKSTAALPLPAGDNIPAVKKNDNKHVLTYAGNEPFFGVDSRKYWVHNTGQSPWLPTTAKFAVYEHALESRPFAIAVTPLFQKTWVKIGDASTAPAAFLARAKAHTGKATVASFLAGPSDCGKYELEPVAALVTNATMAAVAAPAPLAFFRTAMIMPTDFVYSEVAEVITSNNYTRMRRSSLLPGEDGMGRERRELKHHFRAAAAGLTKRQKEHIYHAGSDALEDSPEGEEAFLDHFVESAVIQFEEPADEEHHRARRSEQISEVAAAIQSHPDLYTTRTRRQVCSEASSADCHPWGSGGNSDAATHKQCNQAQGGSHLAYADCGEGSTTAGYGWENYVRNNRGAVGNPWVCADDLQLCKEKNMDYKVFELGFKTCGPNPLQYFARDPYTKSFYMCRSAMQGVGFSAKAKFGKVFGVCTPSITGSGYMGRDNSCTLMGSLGISGNLDCQVEMFGYGIYGGAGVSFTVEIYKGFAQGVFAVDVYIAAGDKKDPFLTGSLTVEMSEWSMACCYKRQKRLKVDIGFEVDVWWLPTFSYNAVLYNAKFGSREPVGCSSAQMSGCDCSQN